MHGALRCGAVVVWVCASVASGAAHASEGLPIEPQVLSVAFVNACGASDALVATAARDAARVWSEAGVTVRWMRASDLPYGAPLSDWIVVRCIGSRIPMNGKRLPHLPIAAIRFIGSQPTNTILASVASASALLDKDTREVRDMSERFRAIRELWLGRMLGRAIAHEIGHFLTQSVVHTRGGLMRATHSVGALTGDSLVPFRIDHADLTEAANRTEAPMTR